MFVFFFFFFPNQVLKDPCHQVSTTAILSTESFGCFLFFSYQLLICSLFSKGKFDGFILQEMGQPLYSCSCPPLSGGSMPGKDINPGESLVTGSHIIPCKYLWKH